MNHTRLSRLVPFVTLLLFSACGGASRVPSVATKSEPVKAAPSPRRFWSNTSVPRAKMRLLSADERDASPPASFVLLGDSAGLLHEGRRVVAKSGEFNIIHDATTFARVCEGKGEGFYFVEERDEAKTMPRLFFAAKFGGVLNPLGWTADGRTCGHLTYRSLAQENRLLVPALAKDVGLPKELRGDLEKIEVFAPGSDVENGELRMGFFGRKLDPRWEADEVLWLAEETNPKKKSLWMLTRSMLLRGDDVWTKMSEADAQLTFKADANNWISAWKYRENDDVCVKKIDPLGKVRSCSANPPDLSAKSAPSLWWETAFAAKLASGRRNAKESVVTVSKSLRDVRETKVFLSNTTGTHELVDPELVGCRPLATERAFLTCSNGSMQSTVRLDEAGKPIVEARRTVREDPVAAADWGVTPRARIADGVFSTSEGGLALAGSCEGEGGNMACVRGPDGKYATVNFARPLVEALNRTATATYLLPRPDGELYVWIGTMDRLSKLDISVYHASTGRVTRIERFPAWIADVGSFAQMFVGADNRENMWSSSDTASPDNRNTVAPFWRSSETVSLWPIARMHPAFKTKENCRFDVSLDGTTGIECVMGQVHAAGRFGLWEKSPGVLFETLDAGETWTPVTLPKNAPTDDIQCGYTGCRIGIYLRDGWGEQAQGISK